MHSLAEPHPLICVQRFVGGRELPGYVRGKEGDGLKTVLWKGGRRAQNCLVEKENQDISYFDQHFVEIMFCSIHELVENPHIMFLCYLMRFICEMRNLVLTNRIGHFESAMH